jgi:hypothetical protein
LTQIEVSQRSLAKAWSKMTTGIHAGFDTQSFVQYCMNRDENLNRTSHSIFSALSTIPNCRRPINSPFPVTRPLLSYSMVHFLNAVSVVQFPNQATKCQLKPCQRKAEENTIWTHVLIIAILRLPSRKVCLSTESPLWVSLKSSFNRLHFPRNEGRKLSTTHQHHLRF